eukprot:gene21172-62142_t
MDQFFSEDQIAASSGPWSLAPLDHNHNALSASKGMLKRDCGMIFHCTQETMWEVMNLRLFGAPKSRLKEVLRIRDGAPLFLHDMHAHTLAGPYWAVGSGAESIEPNAWPMDGGKTRYPAQVRVRPDVGGVVSLDLHQWMHLVSWTEYEKFDPVLKEDQARGLIELFSTPPAVPPSQ